MPAYSGLWNNEYNEDHSLLSSSVKKGNAETMVARQLSKRTYGRAALRELMITLTGAAAGSAALATHKRVEGVRELDDNLQGGLRPIETFEAVNRNTAAADETRIEAFLEQSSQPSTYATDAGGNGGGGKLGF